MPIAEKDVYRTDPNRPRSLFSKIFLSPKFMFYPQIFWVVLVNSRKALKGDYDHDDWAKSSLDILNVIENVGMNFEITGMDNIGKIDGPVVFVGNHMSTLETFILPGIIQPVKKTVTFVVKKSLLDAPVFGPVMRSRDPVVVGRVNPREDLRTVLEDGTQKIRQGRAIIIFPQSTRSVVFKPEDFNSLGIKLAARAGVPVVPFALKTDAWGIGRFVKEFGPVDIHKKIYFSFGEPMEITGRGSAEHEKVIRFIQNKLDQWRKGDS